MSFCKGCGKQIAWGITVEGKKIPLDTSVQVYKRFSDSEVVERVPSGSMGISHFLTCPKANQFSGSKSGSKKDA